MVNTSVYSRNIVTARTVGIYGICNEINISIVVLISLLFVVLTMFCRVINHVPKIVAKPYMISLTHCFVGDPFQDVKFCSIF